MAPLIPDKVDFKAKKMTRTMKIDPLSSGDKTVNPPKRHTSLNVYATNNRAANT